MLQQILLNTKGLALIYLFAILTINNLNVVDYFTFIQRLETKGKYDVNFFEFLHRIDEFKKKKFIQTMLTYYKDVKNKNNKKNEYVVYKEVYNICISAINVN